jgi:hypothetical protein
MFIAYTNTDVRYVEGKLTWDDIPQDAKITSLSITFPFTVNIGGTEVSPKVNIKDFDAYFFYNEAIMSMIANAPGAQSVPVLQAKVIAGISFNTDTVTETRLDKYGNASVNTYKLQDLKDLIKANQFRASTIRYSPHTTQVL